MNKFLTVFSIIAALALVAVAGSWRYNSWNGVDKMNPPDICGVASFTTTGLTVTVTPGVDLGPNPYITIMPRDTVGADTSAFWLIAKSSTAFTVRRAATAPSGQSFAYRVSRHPYQP